MKKSLGQIELLNGMFLLFYLMVILFVQIQMKQFLVTGSYAEDALAASNLASAVVDVEEYGKTKTIRIDNPDEAYGLYRNALKYNFNLDEEWKHENPEVIAGKVEILEYIVYNVEQDRVTVCSFGPYGWEETQIEEAKGRICSPDGSRIESTSVYSKIRFPVRGVFGMEIMVEKQKTVDVVDCTI